MRNSTQLYLCHIAKNPGLPVGPEIVLSPKAFCETLDFIVRREPEAGGLLFGPYNQAGVDTFFGDAEGSRNASRSIYSPDYQTLNGVCETQALEDREMKGMIHSHPEWGRGTFPSEEVAYGRGDRGYARKFFDYNESAQFLLFPILTYNDSEITISPFVFERAAAGNPPDLKWAPFRLREAQAFGEWDYNPVWIARLSRKQTNQKKEIS